jgi:ferredoxin
MPKITFSRENREIEVPAGTNLRKAALEEGIQLYPGIKKYLNCHGFSQCGECRVYIQKGMENTSEKTFLEKLRIAVSWFKFGHENEVRLACQTFVNGDIEVRTQPEFNWFGERKKRATAARE